MLFNYLGISSLTHPCHRASHLRCLPFAGLYVFRRCEYILAEHPMMYCRMVFRPVISPVMRSWYLVKSELAMCISAAHPVEFHVDALRCFWDNLLFSSPFAVDLSVCIGVFGCRCPSSSSVFLAGTTSLQFINSAPSSASAADDITAFIIRETFITAPLFAGIYSFPAMNQFPPALILAFDSDK